MHSLDEVARRSCRASEQLFEAALENGHLYESAGLGALTGAAVFSLAVSSAPLTSAARAPHLALSSISVIGAMRNRQGGGGARREAPLIVTDDRVGDCARDQFGIARGILSRAAARYLAL